MKGGVGTASLRGPDGLVVGAIMVVNAAGSVYDRRTGRVVAGVRTPDGSSVADPFDLMRQPGELDPPTLSNTSIGVVATNARLTKAQAKRIAIMAQDGFARSIFPSHTPGDGDTIFVLATGTLEATPNLTRIGTLASETVSDAVIRAVREATGVAGYPALRDLKR
jgi:L-aminopeptidase/D-esterase-like protein